MSGASGSNALADYRWLVSDAAEAFLSVAMHETDPLRRAARLRAALPAERARLVAEQAALRWRARRKFSAPERLFFTPLGLVQATDAWIARCKARRFLAAARVIDFCCGIGGDLMALALQQPVVGVDRDPVAALFAATNVERVRAAAGAWPRAVSVEVDDAGSSRLDRQAMWHIDPDRRSTGRRTTQPAGYDPPAETIDRMRAASPDAAVKLAPAASVPPEWSAAAELEWISFGRECRQLVAWFAGLAPCAGQRRATLVLRSGAVRSLVGQPGEPLAVQMEIGRYLFEPDAAVLAADLTGVLALEAGLAGIAPGAVYLTGDRPLADPALAAFEVTDVMPLDLKRLKGVLRERRIGRLEVKKRGVADDPLKVAQQLKVPGEHAATLLIARQIRSVVAILAKRVERDDDSLD